MGFPSFPRVAVVRCAWWSLLAEVSKVAIVAFPRVAVRSAMNLGRKVYQSSHQLSSNEECESAVVTMGVDRSSSNLISSDVSLASSVIAEIGLTVGDDSPQPCNLIGCLVSCGTLVRQCDRVQFERRLDASTGCVDPLCGGGKERNFRRAKTVSRMDTLEATVLAIQASLASLMVTLSPSVDEKKPKLKRKSRKSTASVSAPESLWDSLSGLYTQFKDKPPSDDVLRDFLSKRLGARAQVSHTPLSPNTPRQQTPVAAPSVVSGDWTAKVITFKEFKSLDVLEPSVVHCKDDKEISAAKSHAGSMDSSVGITFVKVAPSSKALPGSDRTVLCHSRAGAIGMAAQIVSTGVNPPTQKSSRPTGIKDDDSTITDDIVTFYRLTAIKEFTNTDLIAKAIANPDHLPGLLLPDTAVKKIIKVRGALPYKNEVTCLIRIDKRHVGEFEALKLPQGITLNAHKSDHAPQWCPRLDEDSSASYFSRATSTCTSLGGRLVYRPTLKADGSCLGVLASKTSDTLLAPKWFLSKAPSFWVCDSLDVWARERGFSDVSEIVHHGHCKWFFRGRIPDVVPDINTSFSFTNGITIGMARSSSTSRARNTTEATPKDSWGARVPPPDAPSNLPAVVIDPDISAADIPVRDSGGDLTMTGDSPAQPNPQSKRVRLDSSGKSPWADYFVERECGGEGDCAPCSIGTGLFLNNNPDAEVDKQYGPRGRRQGQMRQATAKEIVSNHAHYPIIGLAARCAAAIRVSGKWFNSLYLHALAAALNIEIRIWAFDTTLSKWNFYIITSPYGPKTTISEAKIVYLSLINEHYRLLRPNEFFTDKILEQWMSVAVWKPCMKKETHLKGVGFPPGLSQ